jgi:hypothetical protein
MSIPRLPLLLMALLLPAPAVHAQEEAPGPPHRILADDGSVVHGRVLGIEGRRLRWAAPWQDGASQARTGRLKRVEMAPVDIPPHPRMVRTTTGESLAGTLVKLDQDALTLRTEAFGDLSVRREHVAQVVSGRTGEVLYASDFSGRGIGRWEAVRGWWNVSGEMMLGTRREQENDPGFPRAALPLDQAGPLTFEIEFRPLGRRSSLLFVMLYAITPEGHDGVNLNLRPDGYTLKAPGVSTKAAQVPEEQQVPSPVWRMAWDPVEGQAIVWHGEHEVGRHEIRKRDRAGNYVVLFSMRPVGIRSVRVLAGIVGPKGPEGDARDAEDVLVLSNGDRVPVTGVRIKQEEVTVEMAGTEASFDLDKLQRILTARNTRTRPDVPTDAALLFLPQGRVLLSDIQMDAGAVRGISPVLGKLEVPRTLVQRIDWAAADEIRSGPEKKTE